MINKKVMILTPLQDYSKHKLAKYIRSYMGSDYPFDLYYYEPLKKLFSKVIPYDFTKQITKMGVTAANKEIIEIVKREKPDYFVWTTIFYELLESTAEAIRKEGTKIVALFFDDEWRFEEYSKWYVPYIDYFVTNDAKTIPKYNALGAKAIYAQGFNGIPLKHDLSLKEEYEVSFIGNNIFDREEYIKEIRKKGLPVSVFGPGWEKFGGRYVSFKELLDIFGSSKINLCFTKTHYGKTGWKGRIFQVCAAGGFLLTEYIFGIEDYFEVGKEIVCFKDKEEMLDKIQYYLKHEDERRKIAKAGWKKVTSKYTPFHMMLNIFKKIESGDLIEPASHISQTGLPKQVKKKFSNYYLHWAIALSLESYEDLWKDALQVSLSYNPRNPIALFYGVSRVLPAFVRKGLFKPLAVLSIKIYREKRKILKALSN